MRWEVVLRGMALSGVPAHIFEVGCGNKFQFILIPFYFFLGLLLEAPFVSFEAPFLFVSFEDPLSINLLLLPAFLV